VITCGHSTCLRLASVSVRVHGGEWRWFCEPHARAVKLLRAGWTDPDTLLPKEPTP
jgi:hypothetical protein